MEEVETETVGATLILRLDVTDSEIRIGHLDFIVNLTEEIAESGNRVAVIDMPEVTDAIRNLIIDINNGFFS